MFHKRSFLENSNFCPQKSHFKVTFTNFTCNRSKKLSSQTTVNCESEVTSLPGLKVGEWGKGHGGSVTGRLFHDHQNGAKTQNLVSFSLNYMLRQNCAYAAFIKPTVTPTACRKLTMESLPRVWATPFLVNSCLCGTQSSDKLLPFFCLVNSLKFNKFSITCSKNMVPAAAIFILSQN